MLLVDPTKSRVDPTQGFLNAFSVSVKAVTAEPLSQLNLLSENLKPQGFPGKK